MKETLKLLTVAGPCLACAWILAGGPPAPPSPAAPPPAEEAAKDRPKLKALIITGDDVPAHNWRETTPVVREALESSGRFQVEVSEKGEDLGRKDLASFDVVVLSYRDAQGRGPSEAALKNLKEYVASGKGLVAVHFAINAFRDWKEYRDLVGRVWVGGKSGHGPRGPFQVKVEKKDHAIVQGLADYKADDELYAKLEGSKDLNVLLSAHSDWSGKVEPLAWTLEHGKGRVFTTVLGHDAPARKEPTFATMLRRGAEWAATGKVTVK